MDYSDVMQSIRSERRQEALKRTVSTLQDVASVASIVLLSIAFLFALGVLQNM